MKEESLLNYFINCLPFELHLPGYNYCGPGTRLKSRLYRKDRPINCLDEYCKQHDIAYDTSPSLSDRHKADIVLMKMSKKRASASDAKLGEKLAANFVNKAMLAKISSGSGLKIITKPIKCGLKKQFKKVISKTKKYIRKAKPKCERMAIEIAAAAAKEFATNLNIKPPRMIPVPKIGGILPLIPIFAGLSAAGSLAGGAAGITKAINDFKEAKKKLAELKRHNEKMEALCIGRGLRLKPYKDGLGIYVSHDKKN